VDDIQDTFAGNYGGAREGEIQSGVAAIGTFKDVGDLALIRRAAAFAEGRIDESNLCPAAGAHKAFRRCCSESAAKLANFRIVKRKGGINPLFERVRQWNHRTAKGTAPGSKEKQCFGRASLMREETKV
jgi:hypothetical protein